MSFATVAGSAAAIGGGLWVAKATAILATGDQPEYVFEIAPPFLALGLAGLHALLGGRGGWLTRAGGILAWIGVVAGVVTALGYVATTDAEAGVLVVTFPLTMLSIVGALVLLAVAVRRVRALPGRWRSLPLGMVFGVVPFIVAGGILEAIDERLLELPLVAYGAAWIALGYAIAREASGGVAADPHVAPA